MRGCRLSNINPQIYNILSHLTELDLGQNQVCAKYIYHLAELSKLIHSIMQQFADQIS